MSLSMFCAIPLPFHLWDDACMKLMLPCFPLIGILIGAMLWGVAQLLVMSSVNIMISAAILTVFPYLITGFLHLDGYMDTSDAFLSRRSLEEKLRILKDPHTGAFAVITLAVLFVLQFAGFYTIVENEKNLLLLITIPVISRCCSALSLLCLKSMPQSQYANMFKQNTGLSHKIFIIITALLTLGAAYLFGGLFGLVIVFITIISFIGAMFYVYKEFKGISGDLSGFAIVVSELCGIFGLALM